MWGAAREGNSARLALLLVQGAEPNAVDPWGNTALHYAAQRADPECVAKLLSAGADTAAKAKWGGTAADLALQFGSQHIARTLREAQPAAERRAAWLLGEGAVTEAAVSDAAAKGGDALALALLEEHKRRQAAEMEELRAELQRAKARAETAVGAAARAKEQTAAVAAELQLAREAAAREAHAHLVAEARGGGDWEVPVQEVKFGAMIGKGGFGDVLRGVWRGQDVAVKRMAAQSPQAAEAFTLEARRGGAGLAACLPAPAPAAPAGWGNRLPCAESPRRLPGSGAVKAPAPQHCALHGRHDAAAQPVRPAPSHAPRPVRAQSACRLGRASRPHPS